MSALTERMKKIAHLPYEELLALANVSLKTASSAFSDHLGGPDIVAKFMLLLTSTSLCADQTITPQETKFVNDLLGSDTDYETMCGQLEAMNTEESRLLVDIGAGTLDPNSKDALIDLCLCFLAVDERITRSEVKFVRKLMD